MTGTERSWLRDTHVRLIEEEVVSLRRRRAFWERLYWGSIMLNVGAVVVILLLLGGR